jgi:nucleotide-binding universal stress UspA family protein
MGVNVANAAEATLHLLSAIATATLGVDVRNAFRMEAGAERPNDHLEETQTFATEADVDSVSGTISKPINSSGGPLVFDDHDIDLVVGTRGRMGFDRYVLESVTEHLVRTSPKPVLTVREPHVKRSRAKPFTSR